LLVILAGIIGVAFRIAHHAEVLMLRFGEPYGTLILTLAAVSVEKWCHQRTVTGWSLNDCCL
jgi:Ca2+:H+ antiporter